MDAGPRKADGMWAWIFPVGRPGAALLVRDPEKPGKVWAKAASKDVNLEATEQGGERGSDQRTRRKPI